MTFKWNGDKYKKKLKLGAVKGIQRSLNIVQRDAVLTAPKITGNLRSTIEQKLFKALMYGIVYTNCEYAPEIEFKRRHMKGHPFLRPSLMDNIQNIRNIILAEERKAIAN
ncbi:MAG: hypothetical protein GY787_19030 [Alteromonadales bacterium]|nr:hypothetical protein [Alteromonadales bacterium]